MKKKYLLLLIFILSITICLYSCNRNLNTIDSWFKKPLTLELIFDSLDCINKWNQLALGYENVESEEFSFFIQTIIQPDSGHIKSDLIINPREDFLKFVRDSLDMSKQYLGAVIKERLTNGSKMSYKVNLYLIENAYVSIFHYVQSPDGFVLEKSYKVDKYIFLKSIQYTLFETHRLDKNENRSFLYCISVFADTPLYSKMVFDDNYFDDVLPR